jgi:hypothetical protein
MDSVKADLDLRFEHAKVGFTRMAVQAAVIAAFVGLRGNRWHDRGKGRPPVSLPSLLPQGIKVRLPSLQWRRSRRIINRSKLGLARRAFLPAFEFKHAATCVD